MSSTGDVSSNGGYSSGYEASNSGSSLACTTLRRSLVMKNAPHLEITLRAGRIVAHSVIIDTPVSLDEILNQFKEEFLALYNTMTRHDDSAAGSESEIDFHFRLPEQSQSLEPLHPTSTPNLVRVVGTGNGTDYSPIVMSGSSDIFEATPEVLVPASDSSTPMEEERYPLAHRQEVQEEVVSEDSLTQSFQEGTRLNSSAETLACSLDITKDNKKTLPHVIQSTPKEKIIPTDRIFEGLRFVLTYDINAELHNSFSKDVTKEQIEAGGGEVLTDLQRGDNPQTTVLISDFSSITRNYLLALVLGVPCVTYIWVEDLCRLNRKCSLSDIHHEYYLQRGQNLLTGELVPPSPTLTSPFTNSTIYLQGSKPFKHQWSDIIRVGGGKPMLKLTKNQQPDIIVTNSSSPFSQTVQRLVRVDHVPAVTDRWLLQSVVIGVSADIDSFRVS